MKNQSISKSLSRRKFVGVIGGGVVFLVAGWKIPALLDAINADSSGSKSIFNGQEVTAWVQIHEDNKITIYNPSSEMGQGSMTALAVIIAEELDADWSKVHVEQSSTQPDIYGIGWGGRGRGNMMTVGSRTVMSYYHNLRQAGAQARYVLMATAAQNLRVPIEELSTGPNKVIHKETNRQLTYGELAKIVKPIKDIPEIPSDQLKNPNDFRLIGKEINRFDIPSKTNGSAVQ